MDTAPTQTLTVSQTINTVCGVPEDCVVRGTAYQCRDAGVEGGSSLAGAVSKRITIDNFHVIECEGNGFLFQNVHDLELRGCIAHRNGAAGLVVNDCAPNATVEGVTARIRVNGGSFRDNGGANSAGIFASAVDGLLISASTEISTSAVGTYQGTGVLLGGKGVARPQSVTVRCGN